MPSSEHEPSPTDSDGPHRSNAIASWLLVVIVYLVSLSKALTAMCLSGYVHL